ncbi:MAG: DUF460 domain-containing protein [Candidatus Altiarchaeota archaeon]
MNNHIIVGVDPGTTTSVAALDMSGKLVGIKSAKDMGAAAVVSFIVSFGKPSLIASDVNPAPNFVSEIATKFGVTLFTPEKTLSVNEKLELTRDYGTGDAHQRDALAAALYAFNQYGNKLRKIDALGLDERVKHFVLQGNSISAAASALKESVEEPEPPMEETVTKPLSEEERRIRNLEKRVRALQEVIEEKDWRIRELTEEIARERRVKHTKAEVDRTAEKRIQTLQAQLKELKKTETLLDRVLSEEIIPVPVYPRTRNCLTLVEQHPHNMKSIKTAFTSKSKIREHLLEHNIQVFDSKELQEQGEIHYITTQRLRELTQPQQKKPDIEKIITEYRRGR